MTASIKTAKIVDLRRPGAITILNLNPASRGRGGAGSFFILRGRRPWAGYGRTVEKTRLGYSLGELAVFVFFGLFRLFYRG